MTYDYQDRTLVFVAPGQVINVDINKDYKPQGYALLFHPDLIRGTSLQLNLSTNYFGDLIKKETGKTALEYIQLKIMALAKQKILENKKTVSEIAYDLGFKYPAHFTRAFKKITGVTPIEYRSLT